MLHKNEINEDISILSDTTSLWLCQSWLWSIVSIKTPGWPRRGSTCSPHPTCLCGCMHGWGLVLCIMYLQWKTGLKSDDLLLHTNYLKNAEGWRQSSFFTWPRGQAIFVLHLTTGTGKLRSSPDYGDRQALFFTWLLDRQASFFTWLRGQASFVLHLTTLPS